MPEDDEIIVLLEMTPPSQLVPGRTPTVPIELREVGPSDAQLMRSTYQRIGAPLRWIGRMGWSDSRWEDELMRSEVRAWIALVDEKVAGPVELEAGPNGEAGIVVFGLVPELTGRGFGGGFLTMATELAWRLGRPDGTATRRVEVQTSSRDHPHALPNYEGRGFRAVRAQRKHPRPRAVGDGRYRTEGE